jgi:ATP-binding protein involved in chromosome partitioning
MSTPITEEEVREQLRKVRYPGFSRDIVSFGIVKNIAINPHGNDLTVFLALATNQPAVAQQINEEAGAALRALPGVGKVDLRFDIQNPPTATTPMGPSRIDGIAHVIAVASGKGGVGKSTVASNIAVALRRTGASVGLCDCDLYGPSIGLMFGSRDPATATEDERINPVEAYGIKLMSMAFLLGSDDSPAILRGPMVTKYTQQFLRRVDWGHLDYLVLDLPPGTGDIQLTIVQTVALSGAVIVTTPQEVALIDARKAVNMFHKTNVPVLGIVENMSYFLCPSDNKRYDIFGNGGGRREAVRLQTALLGEIPIDIATRESGDRGRPITDADPNGAIGRAFLDIAERLARRLPV